MKIAIPIIDTDANRSTIAASLNVNGCLCLYDCEKQAAQWMKTTELAPNMGELLPALIQQSVSVIITEQIHPMALQVLVNKGFVVYRSKGNILNENIDLFKLNLLIPYNMHGAMDFAQVCGGACDSCKTECETIPDSTERN